MQSRFLTMAAGYGPSRVPDNARFVSQLAKVIRQVLCRVHIKVPSGPLYAAADDDAVANACGLAPLISSHNMNAISPTMAGCKKVFTLS